MADPFQPLWDRGIRRDVAEARGYVAYYEAGHPLHDPNIVKEAFASYGLTRAQRTALTRFTNNVRNADGNPGAGAGLIMPKYSWPEAEPIVPQLRPPDAVRTGGLKSHRHDRAYGRLDNPKHLERLMKHIEEEHAGFPPPMRTKHPHPEFGKYLFVPKAKANRLDIHPWAFERLRTAERVYFALEGTPKADAILTKIIATEATASVFDAPSVTLWPRSELETFAGLLRASWMTGFVEGPDGWPKWRGRYVVVVPDADWYTKPAVERQAFFCRQFLRNAGVRACIAAPPVREGLEECECRAPDRIAPDGTCQLCGGYIKGVDDYLYAGGDLDGLAVLDRKADFTLALFADTDGRVPASLRALARILGVRRDPERVVTELHSYIKQGLISTDRELVLVEDEYSGGRRWAGGPKDWPILTIREGLRYTQQLERLGDHEPPPAETPVDAWNDEARWGVSIEDATKRTAERLRTSPDTLRHNDNLGHNRRGAKEARHDMVKILFDIEIPPEVVARWFGISPRTVARHAEEPLAQRDPPPVSEWLQEWADLSVQEITEQWLALTDKTGVGDG
jgi:hypothetical protein